MSHHKYVSSTFGLLLALAIGVVLVVVFYEWTGKLPHGSEDQDTLVPDVGLMELSPRQQGTSGTLVNPSGGSPVAATRADSSPPIPLLSSYDESMLGLESTIDSDHSLSEKERLSRTWSMHIDIRLGFQIPKSTKDKLMSIHDSEVDERDQLDARLERGDIVLNEYRGMLADIIRRHSREYAAILTREQYVELMDAAPEDDLEDLLFPPREDEDSPRPGMVSPLDPDAGVLGEGEVAN